MTPRRLLHAVTVVLLGALPALAQVATPQIGLLVDPLGVTSLRNLTNDPVSFNGYQIVSPGGLLSPAGWQSISDQALPDSAAVKAALGAGALVFNEANPSPMSIAELNLDNFGTLTAAAQFAIGRPFVGLVTPYDDLRFFFSVPGEPVPFEGPLNFVQPPGGQLVLWVDVDGTTYLYNNSAGSISFDGYQIVSETKGLDVATWSSIQDQIPTNASGIIAGLGAGALGFGEAAPTESQLAELNLAGGGTLQPGAKWGIGKPFKDPWNADATADFFYKQSGAATSTAGDITFVPEPSSAALALVAVLGCVICNLSMLQSRS